MKEVLLFITADPRETPRTAEGFRVADGLSLTEELKVRVLIGGAAAQAFADPKGLSHDWKEGLLLLRHLSAAKQRGVPLHIEGKLRAAFDLSGIQLVSKKEAAALRAQAFVMLEF